MNIAEEVDKILLMLKQEYELESDAIHNEGAKFFVLEFKGNHFSFFQEVVNRIKHYITKCIIAIENRDNNKIGILVNYTNTKIDELNLVIQEEHRCNKCDAIANNSCMICGYYYCAAHITMMGLCIFCR